LLDTHIAIWAILGAPMLPRKAADFIQRSDNEVWVSTVSLWEIAIKNGLKRVGIPPLCISAAEANLEFEQALFRPLAISLTAIVRVETLVRHHGDPFDRLLVAQAQTESMHLLTHDKALENYGDFVLVV